MRRGSVGEKAKKAYEETKKYWDGVTPMLKEGMAYPVTSEPGKADADTQLLEAALVEISRIHEKGSVPVSIVYMDIDGLSLINKRFGAEVGNEVIRVIEVLFEDIYRDHYWVKSGMDEFISCLSGVDIEEAIKSAKRLRELIHSYDWVSVAPDLRVTGSFGIAQFHHYETVIDWLLRAIQGSYMAKKAGGNQVKEGPLALSKYMSRKLSDYLSE